MQGLTLSTHAAQKMRARGITLTEVEECVTRPEVTYGSDSDQVRQKGSVAVVVRLIDQDLIVLTVLLRHQERWTDADARARDRQASIR